MEVRSDPVSSIWVEKVGDAVVTPGRFTPPCRTAITQQRIAGSNEKRGVR
jgi:hypothetical protein